jgi:hypothetical protein
VPFTPTTIPLLRRVETAGDDVGLISIDVFDESWQLQVGFETDDPNARVECSVREGEHRSFVGRGGGGGVWYRPDARDRTGVTRRIVAVRSLGATMAVGARQRAVGTA